MKNGVYKLIKETTLPNGTTFSNGQEFEIVNGVLYIGGFPLDFRSQSTILKWMETNKNLFKDVTRGW